MSVVENKSYSPKGVECSVDGNRKRKKAVFCLVGDGKKRKIHFHGMAKAHWFQRYTTYYEIQD